jgi:hypothetical protein
MRVIVACSTLALALAGCAQQQIETQLNAHVGRPASSLFSKLNYPDSVTTIGGRRAYVWGTDRSDAASIFSPSGGGTQRPVMLVSNAVSMVPVDHVCRIQVMVDANEQVVGWQSQGNQGGCAPYARRLSR